MSCSCESMNMLMTLPAHCSVHSATANACQGFCLPSYSHHLLDHSRCNEVALARVSCCSALHTQQTCSVRAAYLEAASLSWWYVCACHVHIAHGRMPSGRTLQLFSAGKYLARMASMYTVRYFPQSSLGPHTMCSSCCSSTASSACSGMRHHPLCPRRSSKHASMTRLSGFTQTVICDTMHACQ